MPGFCNAIRLHWRRTLVQHIIIEPIKFETTFNIIKRFNPKSRITNAEATVVQKLNQGTNPKSGCNQFRGSFFVTFLEKQKSK